jgi:plastocyanin
MIASRAFAPVVVAAFLTAGCGGGGGYGGSTPPTNPTPTPTPGGNVITINVTGVKGVQSFSPNPATCLVGQTVVFHNIDVVTHRVMLDDGSIDTGDIAPGASSSPQPLGAVSKSYHCAIHPSMVGSLNAAATPDPPPCTGYCG